MNPIISTPRWWRRPFTLTLIIGILLIMVPNFLSSKLGIAVLNQMFIMVVFTLAYNMLLGQGGMLSFGHAVYFGLGGYFCIHFMNAVAANGWPIPLPLVPIIGGLAGMVLGAIIGSFSSSRAGTVFAMISLGVGELVASSMLIFSSFSGGEEGVTTDRTGLGSFLGLSFAQDRSVYWLITFWMLVSVYLMYKFSRTPLGRMSNAVRDNPERVQFVGYSPRMIRFLCFMASGFFAGIAGSLFAINYEIVTEETVNGLTSGVVLLQAYIGGVGFFAGPIVGAAVFTLLQTLLSNYTEIWALYVGIIFVATVMYAPAGLSGIVMMHRPIAQRGGLGQLVRPYALCLAPFFVAALGVVGLLETTHALSVGEAEFSLWGMELDAHSLVPWLCWLAIILAGSIVTKARYPAMRDAYENELQKAYRAMESS
jgi:branched-chain amino acid transport system permease protein